MALPIQVLVCDDHPITRFGIVTLFRSDPDFEVIGEVGNGTSAVESCVELQPDLLLLDFRVPPFDAPGVLRELRMRRCAVPVLVLTGVGSVDCARLVLRLGARGFVQKSTPHPALLAAARTTARGGRAVDPEIALALATNVGGTPLSPRELEVLATMASGATNREIGAQLGMAEGTVRTHVAHLLDKLDAGDRTEAVVIALRRGLIPN